MAALPFQSLLARILAERTDPEKAPEPETVTRKIGQEGAENGSEEVAEGEPDQRVRVIRYRIIVRNPNH